MERPMPLAAPVTRATLSSKEDAVLSLCSYCAIALEGLES